MDDDLLPIGRFARLCGLSIGALRHYDDLDLLRPAQVDEWSGYRSYRREQLGQARTIRRLRDLEMPTEEIRELLSTDDPGRHRALLSAHRDRVQARTWRLERVLHVLNQMTLPTEAKPMSTATPIPAELDEATRRQLAKDLFNRTWELLEMPDRTPAQDDEMLHCAHASRYHWGEVGNRQNLAIGEWQCSRVYAVLGRGEPCLWHARRCLDHAQGEGIPVWCLASAQEAMARAYLVNGDLGTARDWVSKARATIEQEPNPEERQIIVQDLETLPLD